MMLGLCKPQFNKHLSRQILENNFISYNIQSKLKTSNSRLPSNFSLISSPFSSRNSTTSFTVELDVISAFNIADVSPWKRTKSDFSLKLHIPTDSKRTVARINNRINGNMLVLNRNSTTSHWLKLLTLRC